MSGFKDVVGHKNIIKYIQNAVTADAVSHAYILNGERGSGKKLLANLFAMSLQCENRDEDGDACGKCRSCRQAAGGNQPDIIRIMHEKPNTIGVGDIRTQVNDDIMIRPYSSKYKIYIIADADMMSVEAQNALLKTIEEPPEYAVIMLLTENAETLLPTIRSRCVMMKLRNIKDQLVKKYLMEQLEVPVRVQTAIAMQQVAEPYVRGRAVRHLEKGRVVVFGCGTGNPFFSTDTASSLRAAEIGAQIMMKATMVDGVYDKDPHKYDDAVKYDTLTFSEVLNKELAVMDMTAASMCKDNHIPVLVFDIGQPDNLVRAVQGEDIGTLVTEG